MAGRLRETGFYGWEPICQALAAYDFGYVFRAVRRAATLTQIELGEVLELDQDKISRIERGERQLRGIALIARVATRLGIPPILLGFGASPGNVAAAPAGDKFRQAGPAHPCCGGGVRPARPGDGG